MDSVTLRIAYPFTILARSSRSMARWAVVNAIANLFVTPFVMMKDLPPRVRRHATGCCSILRRLSSAPRPVVR